MNEAKNAPATDPANQERCDVPWSPTTKGKLRDRRRFRAAMVSITKLSSVSSAATQASRGRVIGSSLDESANE